MANTYTLISSNVLASNTANLTFSSIPSTYTDLLLQVSARLTDNGEWFGDVRLQFNSDTATNYSGTYIKTTPSIAAENISSFTSFYGQYITTGQNATTNSFGSATFYIPSYTQSIHKPIGLSGTSSNNVSPSQPFRGEVSGQWRNTATISSIKVFSSGTFATNSSFYLYGIKNS